MKIRFVLLNGIVCLLPGLFFSLGVFGVATGNMFGFINVICGFIGAVLIGNGRRFE